MKIQEEMRETILGVVLIVSVAVVTIAINIGVVSSMQSEEDIQRCVLVTEYSRDECAFYLDHPNLHPKK